MAEIFAGLDTAVYPGNEWAKSVYDDTNIWYLGYYLGGPNAAAGTESWLGTRAFLAGLGFGFIPTYVGQQVDETQFFSNLTVEQGQADAQEAVSIMTSEGFPAGSVCYLDIEGRVSTSDLISYAAAWIQQIDASGFRAGVYCDGTPGGVADQLFGELGEGAFFLWVIPVGSEIFITVHPQVGDNGYLTYPTPDPIQYHASALGAQWAEAGFSDDPPTVFDVLVDLDSFPTKDPSMPTLPPG